MALKGIELYKTGRYNKSLAAYDKAIGIDPYYSEAIENRNIVVSKLSSGNTMVPQILFGILLISVVVVGYFIRKSK